MWIDGIRSALQPAPAVGLKLLFVALGLLVATPDAKGQGARIALGAGVGGIAVYYNSTGGETPSNVSYFRAQFSSTNDNGAEFNFSADPIPGTDPPGPQPATSWYQLFQAVPNQFGFDLVLPSTPTANGSVPAPALIAYDNGNNSLPGRIPAGPATWAINGYTGPTNGPANSANDVINSLFRGGSGANATTVTGTPPSGPFTVIGDGVVVTLSAPIPTPTGFLIDLNGELTSDGLIHWYTITTPDSPVSNFELTGRFFFSGTLEYTTADDLIVGQDFYAGTVEFEAEVICGKRFVEPTGLDFFSVPPVLAPNNCRDPGQPCQTLGHVLEVRCPADLVQVGDGTSGAIYPDGSLVVHNVSLRASSDTRDTGTAKAYGLLNANDSGVDFRNRAVSGDLVVRIQNGGFDVMVPLTGCTVTTNLSIRCRSVDRNVKARFRTSRADGPFLYRMQLGLNKLPASLAGTTAPTGPIRVVVQEDTVIQRADLIGNLVPCTQRGTRLRCREF